MTYFGTGRILRGVGGLYDVRMDGKEGEPQPLDGLTVRARGRGKLRRKGELLVGDRVRIGYDANAFEVGEDREIRPAQTDGSLIAIEEILERRSALIRPPMANLDVLFVTAAAAEPEPSPLLVDKLICICEYNRIEPVLVITKAELDPARAERMTRLYREAGFEAFRVGQGAGYDLESLKKYVESALDAKIAAFSGASGVGKSTLLNTLFPNLDLTTGSLSQKIMRGKNTTRSVELYPLNDSGNTGFLADTPGFTDLDFLHFDFFADEFLPETFREFAPYLPKCKYRKCSHTVEEGCAVIQAVKDGKIAASRHKSFVTLYSTLRSKPKWE